MTRRVAQAAAIAAVIGAIAFAIWWIAARNAQNARPAAQGARQTQGPAVKPEAERQTQGSGLQTQARVERTLRGAISDDPVSVAAAIAALTNATLVRINPATDDVEPRLAESWTDDGARVPHIYKVALRVGTLWSDGSPLTADEVAAAIRQGSGRQSGMGASRELFTARATGPLTLDIAFTKPFAPGMRALANVPIAAPGGPRKFLGPFVPADVSASDRALALVRNPHYWLKAKDGSLLPAFDRIVLEPTPDADRALVNRLIAGELDFVETELRPDTYTALRRADQDDKIHLYDVGPALALDAIWPDVTPRAPARPMALEQFRLAMSAAIDRRDLCDSVYLGSCDPVFTPVTPGNAAWFLPDLPTAGPDEKLARSMLAALDLPSDRLTLTLLVADATPHVRRGAELVRDQLKAAGITVTLVTKGPHDAVYGRLLLHDSDPAMNLDVWRVEKPSADWQRKLNALMGTVAGSSDKAVRQQAFADAQKLYIEHMPIVCLSAPYEYIATTPTLRNVRPSKHPPALLWNADSLAK